MNNNKNMIIIKEPKNGRGSNYNEVKYEYVLKDKIGEGKFGHVYVAELSHDEVQRSGNFVMKIGADKKSMENEIHLYQHLKKRSYSQYTLEYYGSKYEDRKYYLLLEKFGESLTKYVERTGKLSYIETKIVIISVLRALKHIHEVQTIIHDIKPGNVLILKKRNSVRVKICDFGSALEKTKKNAQKNNNETYVSSRTRHAAFKGPRKYDNKKNKGTWQYQAPELRKDFCDEYDYECDVWSIGLLGSFCLSGNDPVWSAGKMRKTTIITSTHLRPILPPNTPTNILEFLDQFLKIDPARRIKVDTALSDDRNWLQTFNIDLSALAQLQEMKDECIETNDVSYGKLLLFVSDIFVKMSQEFQIFKVVFDKYSKNRQKTKNKDFRRSTLWQILYAIQNGIERLSFCYNWQTVCNMHPGCRQKPGCFSKIKYGHWANNESIQGELGKFPCVRGCGKLFGRVFVETKKKYIIPISCSEVECKATSGRKKMLDEWINNKPVMLDKKLIIDGFEFHSVEEKIDDTMHLMNYNERNKKINNLECDQQQNHLFRKTTFGETEKDEPKCDKCTETDFKKQCLCYYCLQCNSVVCAECELKYYS